MLLRQVSDLCWKRSWWCHYGYQTVKEFLQTDFLGWALNYDEVFIGVTDLLAVKWDGIPYLIMTSLSNAL